MTNGKTDAADVKDTTDTATAFWTCWVGAAWTGRPHSVPEIAGSGASILAHTPPKKRLLYPTYPLHPQHLFPPLSLTQYTTDQRPDRRRAHGTAADDEWEDGCFRCDRCRGYSNCFFGVPGWRGSVWRGSFGGRDCRPQAHRLSPLPPNKPVALSEVSPNPHHPSSHSSWTPAKRHACSSAPRFPLRDRPAAIRRRCRVMAPAARSQRARWTPAAGARDGALRPCAPRT